MIELEIQETGRSYKPGSKYELIGNDTKTFDTLKEAKEFLKEKYGSSSKMNMFFDKDEHNVIHCGYIYGYKNSDIRHIPLEKWLQQDWITFYKKVVVDLEKEK